MGAEVGSEPDAEALFRRRTPSDDGPDGHGAAEPADPAPAADAPDVDPDAPVPGPPWWYRPPWYRRPWVKPAAAALAVVALVGVIVWAAANGAPAPDDTGEDEVEVSDGRDTDPTTTTEATGTDDDTTSTTAADEVTVAAADAACVEALAVLEVSGPFQACTSEQYRRLQPVLAPGKPELVAACSLQYMGPACDGVEGAAAPPAGG